MASGQNDPSFLLTLRTLHEAAIRSYYIYELLEKLVESQQRSWLERISTPASLAASIISLFAFIQNPPSRDLILIAYLAVIVILTGTPIVQSKLSKKNGLDDTIYLGIYLDETAKCVGEINLARGYPANPTVTDFINERTDALKGSVMAVREFVALLRGKNLYPSCLSNLGRSEIWVNQVNQDVKTLTGNGFL